MKNYNMKLARAAMTLLLLLVTSTTVWAQTSASYRAYNTSTKSFETLTANNCTAVTSSTTTMGANNTVTWYVVNSNVSVSDSRIEVFGTVNLILADDKRMRAEKGLHVPEGVTLNIYGQNYGTGHLYSAPQEDRLAGIGGNNEQASGIINIHGGSIEAYGTYQSAAIGGGRAANGGTTTIYGGTVNALGGTFGAGIGGGPSGNCGTVTIIGGTVIARAGTVGTNDNSQAIGSGAIGGSNNGGILTFGDVKVYDSENATEPLAAPNRLMACQGKYVKLMPCTEHNKVNGVCTICGNTDDIGPGISGTYLAYHPATYSFVELTADNPTAVDASTTTMGATGTETWYMVNDDVTISSRIAVNGTVHLILNDDKTLTASKGLHVTDGNALIIYGQARGTGTLNAPSGDGGAAIGGNGSGSAGFGNYEKSGTVTIHGGIVTATGDLYAAGIGCGWNGQVGTVTIYGGRVTANGGGYGAGIGGGRDCRCGNVIIKGGTVVATSVNNPPLVYGNGSTGGSLTLGNMRVYSSSTATTPVEAENRVRTCTTAPNSYPSVRLELCTAHYWMATNKNICKYCDARRAHVYYNSNGATGGAVPADGTAYVPASTFTVLGNTGSLVKTGYAFAGWNTAADGSGIDYAPGATFTIHSNITLYAQWTPVTYIVRFNKNHDDATGTMDDQTFTYDAEQALTANTFTCNGYQFAGWSTATTGTTTYLDGQRVSNLATEQDAVVNLYAIWTQHLYTITYNLNGGSVATPNPTTYSELTQDITLVNPTRAGYDFKGWTGSNGSTAQTTVTIPHGSSGDRTYTANWYNYYRAYDTGTFKTKTLSSAPNTVTSGTTSMGTNNQTKWYVVENNVTVNSRITVSGTVNLILRDGAKLTVPKGITVHSGNTLNIYGQNAGTGTLIASSTDGNNAAIGALAEGNTLGTINIHGGRITANGGSWSAGIGGGVNSGGGTVRIYGGTVNATGHDGISEAIGCGSSGSAVTKYLADGLCVKVNNSSTPVAYSERMSSISLSNLQQKVAKVEFCTAHNFNNNSCSYCGAAAYTLTYNSNSATSGTVPTGATAYGAGQTVTVLGNTGNLVRNGYLFNGWNTKADGTGTSYAPGATFDISSTTTLYARWAQIYTITYDLGGGSADNPTSYSALSDAFTLVNPVREGSTFAGWTGTGLTEPTMTVTIPHGSTGNRDYTANWTIVTYSITCNLNGGSVATPNPTSYTYVDEAITLVNPTREGYDFAGWTGSNGNTPQTTVTIPTGSTGNRSYTANWALIYSISYDGLEEGSFPTEHPTTYTELSEDFTLVNPVRELYDFAGWTGTDLTQPTMTVIIPHGSTGNRSYTATWSRKDGIYVSYNTETNLYETHAVDNPIQIESTSATEIGTAGQVTWYLVKQSGVIASNRLTVNGTVNLILADGASLTANKGINVHAGNALIVYGQEGGSGTLNATGILYMGGSNWESSAIGSDGNGNGNANAYLGNLTFHGGVINATGYDEAAAIGGGHFNPASGSITIYGGTITAKTKNNYNSNPMAQAIGCGASGAIISKSIIDGMRVYTNYSTTPTLVEYDYRIGNGLSQTDVRVERCTEHNYQNGRCTYCGAYSYHQITYYGNGNMGGTAPEVATCNVTIGIHKAIGTIADAGSLERTGYTFTGWNTEADGSGTDYAPGETVTLSSNLTLYAQWTLDEYTITYDLHGGILPEGESNPTTYTVNSYDIKLVNPTREGYKFMGWTGTDLDEATETVFILYGSLGDRSYTATWDLNVAPFEGIEIDHDYTEGHMERYYIKMPSPGDFRWDEELEEEVWFAEETPKIVNIPEWFTSAFKVYDDGGKDDQAQSNPSESHITTLILNAPEGKAFSVQGVLDIAPTWYDETDWLKIYDGTGTDNEIHCATENEFNSFITSSNSIRFDLHIENGHYPSNMNLIVSVIDAPIVLNLVENSLTPNGATVEWTGPSESYTLQYAEGDPFIVLFSEGFEDGSLPEGWTTSDGSYWAIRSGTGHEDYTGAATGNFNATCFYDGQSHKDNYLITPVMDLSGATSASLTFNYRNVALWGYNINELQVYYRVNGGSWLYLYSNTSEVSSWTPVTIPLQGLAANYQIGFQCNMNEGYGMGIDDVKIFVDNPALAWTTADNAASPYTFDNLDFETTYSVRVIGTQPDRISNILGFTTLERCPAPTNLEIVENSLSAYGATVNWKGFSDNYNIKLGEVKEDNYLVTDFETGSNLSQGAFTFTTTSSYPWTVVENNHSGSRCAKSTNKGIDSSVSDMVLEVTLATDETLTFSAKVSSEENYDKAYFSIDGCVEIDGISGEGDWIDYSYPLTAGTHTLRWYYTKDGSEAGNYDCFYVDDIRITNGSTEVGIYTSDTNSYTLTGLSAGTTYKVQVQADAGTDGNSDWSSPIMFTTNFDLILANAADNSDAISMAATNGGEFNVTLAGRTLWKDGDWNTLCLPFDLGDPQAEEGHYFDGTLLEGATVKTLGSTDFSDGTLTMNFVDVHEIAAGTPFLVKWTSGENEVNPVFTGVTISNATTNVETKYVDFIGTYAPVTYASEDRSVLFMGGGSNLYYPDGTSTITINACRAYFTLNDITAGGGGEVKGFALNFGEEDDADGISSLTPDPSPRRGEEWYDLAGRKMVNGKLSNGKMPKGIYIRDGKKILY